MEILAASVPNGADHFFLALASGHRHARKTRGSNSCRKAGERRRARSTIVVQLRKALGLFFVRGTPSLDDLHLRTVRNESSYYAMVRSIPLKM